MDKELSVVNVNSDIEKTAQSILDENDLDKVKDLTHLFNLNQAKKNVVRIMKLNGLMDTVADKIIERFEKYPDNFSNAELLSYLQVTQNTIEKASKSLELIDETPTIQFNNNTQVNVSIIDSLDRESKARVADVIRSILNSKNVNIEDNKNEVVIDE